MLAQQVVNALILGSMYSLMAVGFTLYFGTLNVINLSHGAVYMIGAFAALVFARGAVELPIFADPLVATLGMFGVAMAFAGGVGVAIEFVCFRPLRRAPALVVLISSLGMYIVVAEGVLNFFPDGANPQVFPDPFLQQNLLLGQVVITHAQILLGTLSFVLICGTYLFVSRTRYGRAIRALSADREAAEMMGIDVDRTVRMTFVVGSALGAAGGVMEGMNYGSVMFNMGFNAAIKGFTAAVIGGLGNVYGAMAGGFLLAAAEVLASAYVPGGSQYKNVIAFALLIGVLVVRPSGLLSRS